MKQKWLGGYVREGRGGPTFIIERWIRGIHFHVSTRCRTERAALKQFELFEADPTAYQAGGPVARDGVTMSSALILRYCDWMTAVKKNSKHWVKEIGSLLFDWEEDLQGKDLRTVSMQRDLKPALNRRVTSRRHRVEAIKGFYAWLRKEEGSLGTSEDATLDLPVPVTRAAKLTKRKVVEPELVLAVLKHLPEQTMDVLHFQTGTAWHISEVRRFSKEGVIDQAGKAPLGPLVTLTVLHKKREPHTTPISQLGLVQVAERIRARGNIPSDWTLNAHMTKACKAAGVERFTLGVMRHSVLTLAVELGASPQQASEFAGHKSLSTTKTFYLDLKVPTVSVPVLRIVR